MTDTSHEHHHPTPRDYVKVAAVLAVLTAFEVSLYYLEISVRGDVAEWVFPVGLLILSAIKFLMVVGYFMHLRYERPLLSRFFSVGAVLAVGLYLTVLAALGAVSVWG